MKLSINALKTPEDFRRYNKALFRAAIGEKLWRFLDDKEKSREKEEKENDSTHS